MKKLNVLLILLFSAVLISGCYDDSKNATVRINLGNMPVAKQIQKKSVIDTVLCILSKEAYAAHPSELRKLHLTAFKENNRIALKTVDITEVTENPQNPNNETVEFEVPSGDNINIVILAETDIQEISHYGISSATVDLNAGEVTTVVIDMNTIQTSAGISAIATSNHSINWQKLSGVSKYYLEIQDQVDPQIYYPLWSGLETSYINTQTAVPYYRMRIEFGFINRFSSYIEFQAIPI